VGPGVGDLFPGALAAFGILAAVLHAQKTGEGQFVDVAMVDGVLALCERIVHQYSYAGVVAKPEGNRHPILCPFGLFRARDGWISIAAQSESFWSALCKAMNRSELIRDPRFSSNGARLANKSETYALVDEFVARHSVAELVGMLAGQLPLAPVYSVEDIFADPHFTSRGMLAEVEQPGSKRPVTIAGVPVKLSATPGKVRHRAPLLGEHSDAILAELGFGERQIEALREAKVLAPRVPEKLP
jgi:crotonobetainyl-CoA:carnitine CoA-transferase CaiB-like acyl-CoA transferase